jgi:hypothetical protein
MAQKAILYQPTLSVDPDLSYELSDAFLGQSDDQICNSLPKTSCEADAKFNESHDSQVPAKGLSDSSFLYVPNENMSGQKVSSVKIHTEGFPVLSTEQLIIEQNKGSELSVLISKALSKDEMSCVPVCFYVHNGVLMRKWRPVDVPANEEWTIKHQIVLPRPYRNNVFSMAHETALSGHLGVNKTYYKILEHFYWPKLRKNASEYCVLVILVRW